MKVAILRFVGVTTLACMLAACGGRQPLKPIEGQRSPAVPVGASTVPTAAQLTRPSTQARPERNVELLTQSEERKADPFDLPPEKQIR